MFEKVYMVWDIYDGVRAGLADFKGKPHYFSSVFDGEYTDKFELSLISKSFFNLAIEQWKIYQSWEFLYHSGDEDLKNHPGQGNVSKRYDEIEKILKDELPKFKKLNFLVRPDFEVLEGQDHLPDGVLKEIEVCWHEIT